MHRHRLLINGSSSFGRMRSARVSHDELCHDKADVKRVNIIWSHHVKNQTGVIHINAGCHLVNNIACPPSAWA